MPKPPAYIPQRRTDRNEIVAVVARERERLGLTQEDLAGRAAAIGWTISRDVVKRIERGERKPVIVTQAGPY